MLHGRRAISLTISSVILVGAVVAASSVWLVWTQSLSSVYVKEGSDAIDAHINRLKETLVFEYTFYDWSDHNLNVYLMNCGTINDTTVKTVYITNTIGELIKAFSNITLKDLNGEEIADQDLDMGEEGYVVLSSFDDLVADTSYSARVVTGRGATFHHTLVINP